MTASFDLHVVQGVAFRHKEDWTFNQHFEYFVVDEMVLPTSFRHAFLNSFKIE